MQWKFVTTSLAAALLLLGGQVTKAGNAPGYTNCKWRGTAPICAGKCLPGEVRISPTREAWDGTYGKKCITGDKVWCCKPLPQAAPEAPPKQYKQLGKKKPEPSQPQVPPKAYKQLGKKVQMACANNNVDVYDSPVEPRNVVGMMAGGAKAKIYSVMRMAGGS